MATGLHDLPIAERKMADLHGRGIRAIVDLTTVDLGRDIDLIVDVALFDPQ
jgi:predicted metal-dependent phosphotriesterase family hydrolase